VSVGLEILSQLPSNSKHPSLVLSLGAVRTVPLLSVEEASSAGQCGAVGSKDCFNVRDCECDSVCL
jgi:hypothetical protein